MILEEPQTELLWRLEPMREVRRWQNFEGSRWLGLEGTIGPLLGFLVSVRDCELGWLRVVLGEVREELWVPREGGRGWEPAVGVLHRDDVHSVPFVL